MPADAYLSPDLEVLFRLMVYFQGSLGTLHAHVPTRDHTVNGPHGPFVVRVYTPPGGEDPGLRWSGCTKEDGSRAASICQRGMASAVKSAPARRQS
jgi:hypothetical protein